MDSSLFWFNVGLDFVELMYITRIVLRCIDTFFSRIDWSDISFIL